MIGGILFFIIEFKFGVPDDHNLAQLFLELLSGAEQNSTLKFAGLRIYGLLTDLILFKFYSYDPANEQFCIDETIVINNKRIGAFSDMIDVSNKIFGVVLSAYMDGLRAIISRSKDRAKCNDKPSELTGEEKKPSGRKSTDQWEAALTLAQGCVEKFREPVATLRDIENRGNAALELLTKSVRSIPRASTFSGGINDPSTPAELKALAVSVTETVHEHYLSAISQ